MATKSTGKYNHEPVHLQKRIGDLLRALSIPILFSILYPLAIYYGLRVIGADSFDALIIGALPIVGYQFYQFIRNGTIDKLGIFMMAILGCSVALAFATGSARFMLAKGGFFTALIGIGFLISLFLKKPVVYTIAAYLLCRMQVSAEHLETLWTKEPKFRRVWKISTIIWGIGTLFNALIVLITAYSLPIDVVPALNTLIHFIVFIFLQIVTNVYYNKQGIWKLVFATSGSV